MKISSTQLEAFFAVARHRNFTKAAAALHITQSALSQRILNLEADLQTSLFIRERSGIELTNTGHELLRYCQLQESFEEEFLGKLQTKKSAELAGVIRIAGFSSVMRSVVTPSLSGLLLKNPKVRLQILSRELNELPNLLRTGEADFVILDYKLDKEGIESIEIGQERYVLVESKTMADSDVYLDHDEWDDMTERYLKNSGGRQGKSHRHYLDDIYGIIDGVRLGLGRAVVPEHLIKQHKDLRILNPKFALEVPVILHFYKQPFYTQLHLKVVESLKSGASKLLT